MEVGEGSSQEDGDKDLENHGAAGGGGGGVGFRRGQERGELSKRKTGYIASSP